MKISISIHYTTSDSQIPTLHLIKGENQHSYPMDSMPNDLWRTEFELTDVSQLDYYYSVGDRRESTTHSRTLPEGYDCLVVEDRWLEPLEAPALVSSPFLNIFNSITQEALDQKGNLLFEMEYPYIHNSGQYIALVGDCAALGDWDPACAPRFSTQDFPHWRLSLDLDSLPWAVEYKFVFFDGTQFHWEEGENRRREFSGLNSATYYIYNREPQMRLAPEPWRGAGVAIPVFSLRSEDSAGIGDFADLERFARWTASIGGKVVQILPINDTTQTHTHRDSYPYSAISVYALHPLYLSLNRMGVLQDATLAHQIGDRAQQLNNLELLDYDQVDALKWEFFRALYKQDGEATLKSNAFQKFYTKNQYWLKPYALFSFLRDINGTADYSQWGEWAQYDPLRADLIVGEQGGEFEELAIYLYLQFHLNKQLREVRKACAKMGIALKGDIPIGVNRHSVESWTEPHLFNLDCQAGAPPDAFSSGGQNWGFPTYNWQEMAKDGYGWWRKRFEKMYDYFELYRIDHILGFFRIWEIPYHSVEGTLGYFSPALPLSKEELSERGLPLQESYVTPTMLKTEINRLLNKDRDQTIAEFFDKLPGRNTLYSLKKEFREQRAIQNHLARSERSELEKALFVVTNNVLFIGQQLKGEMLYHPRIAAQETLAYKRLTPQEQQNFDKIYEDFFYHRHNDFWAESAREKLPPLIGATPMLSCAEDLGMIPDCVASTLDQMKIITLELERMPKESFRSFGNPAHYPYLSVCTTSTHDMSPIRLWWQELEPQQRDEYYHRVMHQEGGVPESQSIEISKKIVQRHLDSSSILAILPLQDLYAIDPQMRKAPIEVQQINVPSNPDHYWRYRMHTTIEQMEQNKALGKELRKMIKKSNRQLTK